MSRARILILSGAHLCRNPRVLKEASTLAGAGYDVTLLSVSSRGDFERQDQSLMAGQRFRREVVTITGKFWPRARTRLARTLAAAGLESPSALGPASLLLDAARRHAADLVIAHTEIGIWVGQQLASTGTRVAADLEDWHSEDLLPDARKHRPLALLRSAEQFALRRAAYVSVPSSAMAHALHSVHGGRMPVILRNSFPLQPAPSRPARSGPPRLVWFSQTIGPGRGLEAFVAGWGRTTQPSQLHFIGDPRPGYPDALFFGLTAAQRARVDVHLAVPSPELPALLSASDLGLALEPSAPRNKDLTTSNKILQYLNAGLAVVATATAGQREVLASAPGAGIFVDLAEPDATAAALDRLLADPAGILAMQKASRSAAEREFCWEKESPRLLAAVEQALAGPPR